MPFNLHCLHWGIATMPIKVYVWKPKDDNGYGHASMELSDGTYISWWPLQGGKAEQGGSKDLAFPKQTVDTDQSGEGGDTVLKQTVVTDQSGEGGGDTVPKQTVDTDQSGEGRDPVLKQTVETYQPREGRDLVQKQTLDSDVQDKGRNPDLVFVVSSKVDLKEDDIKSWWENIETKDEYNLCNNCYGAVKRAVEAGGAKVDESFTETQGGLIEYMEEMHKMNWEPPQNRIFKKLSSVL